jgi:hypothetical protein
MVNSNEIRKAIDNSDKNLAEKIIKELNLD